MQELVVAGWRRMLVGQFRKEQKIDLLGVSHVGLPRRSGMERVPGFADDLLVSEIRTAIHAIQLLRQLVDRRANRLFREVWLYFVHDAHEFVLFALSCFVANRKEDC